MPGSREDRGRVTVFYGAGYRLWGRRGICDAVKRSEKQRCRETQEAYRALSRL